MRVGVEVLDDGRAPPRDRQRSSGDVSPTCSRFPLLRLSVVISAICSSILRTSTRSRSLGLRMVSCSIQSRMFAFLAPWMRDDRARPRAGGSGSE